MKDRLILLTLLSSLIGLLGTTGCFDPSRSTNLSCSNDGLCPDGLTCGSDNICRSTADLDANTAVADAAIEIDATPVQCTVDTDCSVPPNLCFEPGTCNTSTNLCTFPSVTCNDPDTCATYSCNPSSGSCEMAAVNEGITCDSGTTCDSYDACAYPGGSCTNTGSQSRDCIDRTCSSGTCVASASRSESRSCTRDTLGDTCLPTTCGAYGICSGFAPTNPICDESGMQSRSCTDFTCSGETCISAVRDETKPCFRNTDGLFCPIGPIPVQSSPQDELSVILEGCCDSGFCLSANGCLQ